eukprot:CAMPEP_0182421976 /NCGR_PEP_ID=MMETSP1167-20130531/7565_1 /TAXON_ID=2988 /ORGANISM="Mallomonas Sp, Strain CCMP3275" /LENGTH=357 /DNA_ID=CAMNT_0024599653 /DNA_START=345 /DNA_END=1415 /DNA_ORIENTATION=+
MKLISSLILVSIFHVNISYAADFFHSFGGGGTNPFGSGSKTGAPRGQKHEEFYKRLGVDNSASSDDIKKAYRKEAMKCHPDKGGDAEQFKRLSEAYEVLSDEDKRAAYDQYGEEGIKGPTGGVDPFEGQGFPGFGDIFRSFNMPVMMQLDLTLEDFYTGKTLDIPLRPNTRVKLQVEPGMMSGQQLMSRGHVIDRGGPRDIIFRLNEIRHPLFQRRNADLLVDLRISLKDALLGFERVIRHLDGKDVWIRSRKGEITAADEVFVLRDMGMPVYGSKTARGRLFIRIRVEFPKKMWLNDAQREKLAKLLKHAPASAATRSRKRRADEAAVYGQTSDLSTFGHVGAGRREMEEDESPFS